MKWFSILIIAILYSVCKDDAVTPPEIRINKPADSDGIKRDVPNYVEGVYKNLRKSGERTIGLKSLENGYEGFRIRIFKDYSDHTGWILDLKDSSQNWCGDLYYFKYASTGNYLLDSLAGKKVYSGGPKAGWKTFLKKLFSLDILTMPDYSSIPNYDKSTDETGVIIEMADQKHYRYYEYGEPYWRKSKFKEAAKVVKIIELLISEFSIDTGFKKKELQST